MSNPPLDATAKKLTRPELGLMLLIAAINCIEITDALLVTPLAQKLQGDLLRANIDPETALKQYTFVSAVYGFAAAICGILSSAIMDRFDRKKVVLVAFAGLILSIAATAFSMDFTSLFIARLFAGAFGGLTTCATLAVVGDLIPESRRGAALGLLGASFAVAAVVGIPLSFGIGLALDQIWPSFALVAFLGVAVWVWGLMKLPKVTGHLNRVRGNPLAEFLLVLKVPNHVIAFAFMLSIGLGTYCVIPLMAQYMELNCGVPKGDFAIIFLAMGACSLGSAVLFGKLVDRFGKKPIFFLGIALTMAITLIVVFLPPVSSLVAGVVASAFMAAAVARLVPTHTIMLGAAEPKTRGAFTIIYNSVSLLGTSVGPLVAGLIVNRVDDKLVNYPLAGAVACGFSLLGIGLSFFVKPARAEANA